MTNFARKIGLFFQVVSEMIRQDREDRIAFSRNIFMRLPSTEITLVSLEIDNIRTVKVSIDDARDILRSVKHACDLNQIEEIKAGQLNWRTDARSGDGSVTIRFGELMDSTTAPVKRDAIAAAIAKFDEKFGLGS